MDKLEMIIEKLKEKIEAFFSKENTGHNIDHSIKDMSPQKKVCLK